jgi:aryl-alcohol dehydrogenase-like predicted oxidoreductase
MSSTITLNDSTTTPWIAYGTGTALYRQDANQYVQLAIRSGFTHLDGAQMYANEDSLGNGIVASGKPRSELYVTTKLGKLNAGETVKESLQESLKKLGLAYVDLFLIHSPTHYEGRLKQVWKEMEGVKNDGLTRHVSTFHGGFVMKLNMSSQEHWSVELQSGFLGRNSRNRHCQASREPGLLLRYVTFYVVTYMSFIFLRSNITHTSSKRQSLSSNSTKSTAS